MLVNLLAGTLPLGAKLAPTPIFKVDLSPGAYIMSSVVPSHTNASSTVEPGLSVYAGDTIVVPANTTNSVVRFLPASAHVVDIRPSTRVVVRDAVAGNPELDQPYLELSSGRVHGYRSVAAPGASRSGDALKKIIIRTSGATTAVRGSDMDVESSFTGIRVANNSADPADVVYLHVDSRDTVQVNKGRPVQAVYPVSSDVSFYRIL